MHAEESDGSREYVQLLTSVRQVVAYRGEQL